MQFICLYTISIKIIVSDVLPVDLMSGLLVSNCGSKESRSEPGSFYFEDTHKRPLVVCGVDIHGCLGKTEG